MGRLSTVEHDELPSDEPATLHPDNGNSVTIPSPGAPSNSAQSRLDAGADDRPQSMVSINVVEASNRLATGSSAEGSSAAANTGWKINDNEELLDDDEKNIYSLALGQRPQAGDLKEDLSARREIRNKVKRMWVKCESLGALLHFICGKNGPIIWALVVVTVGLAVSLGVVGKIDNDCGRLTDDYTSCLEDTCNAYPGSCPWHQNCTSPSCASQTKMKERLIIGFAYLANLLITVAWIFSERRLHMKRANVRKLTDAFEDMARVWIRSFVRQGILFMNQGQPQDVEKLWSLEELRTTTIRESQPRLRFETLYGFLEVIDRLAPGKNGPKARSLAAVNGEMHLRRLFGDWCVSDEKRKDVLKMPVKLRDLFMDKLFVNRFMRAMHPNASGEDDEKVRKWVYTQLQIERLIIAAKAEACECFCWPPHAPAASEGATLATRGNV